MNEFNLSLDPDHNHTTATDPFGNAIQMYLNNESGGIRPMQMLVLGLMGCAAVDVVLILKKQRQPLTDFKMHARASREADKEPALWEKVDLTFHLFGDIQPEKAHKAVELSMQKYCSVAETLRRAGGEVTWTITLN